MKILLTSLIMLSLFMYSCDDEELIINNIAEFQIQYNKAFCESYFRCNADPDHYTDIDECIAQTAPALTCEVFDKDLAAKTIEETKNYTCKEGRNSEEDVEEALFKHLLYVCSDANNKNIIEYANNICEEMNKCNSLDSAGFDDLNDCKLKQPLKFKTSCKDFNKEISDNYLKCRKENAIVCDETDSCSSSNICGTD